MKMGMKTTLVASVLAIGLSTGIAAAQTDTAAASPKQQMHHQNENMMNGGMKGGGMQGGNMMGGNMAHKGMMKGQGMGCDGMMSGNMMNGNMMNQMSQEQRNKFLDQTVDQRKQMMEMRFSYMEAKRNGDTDPQALAAIEKEMLELRTQMMDKMEGMQGR